MKFDVGILNNQPVDAVVRQVRLAESLGYQHATAASRHRELVPDRFVDLMALAGTPDEVVEQVRRVRQVPGVNRIIILPQVPGGDFGALEDMFRLFAEEVMARV